MAEAPGRSLPGTSTRAGRLIREESTQRNLCGEWGERGQPERGYSILRTHRPSGFIFFLPQNQSLPGNCLLLAPATLKTGEGREGRLLLLPLNGAAYSSIPVVTRLRLKPVFSNKSFLSNKFSLIPASLKPKRSQIRHGNSRMQPSPAAPAGNTKRTRLCRPTQRNQSRCRCRNQPKRTRFRSRRGRLSVRPIPAGSSKFLPRLEEARLRRPESTNQITSCTSRIGCDKVAQPQR